MCGPTFPDRLRGSAECDTTALIIAFEAARRVFRLDEAWDAVSALDLKISAEAQAFLRRTLASKREERGSVRELLADPYMQPQKSRATAA
jgi:NAD-specific glutamate dehydrogenase